MNDAKSRRDGGRAGQYQVGTAIAVGLFGIPLVIHVLAVLWL
jgi:hypothetical protein